MAVSSTTIEARPPRIELNGRWIDALLGYGLLYLLSIPLILLLARSQGLEAWPIWFVAVIALGLSAPHYGATLLRVYEKRADRHRYAFFSIWVTLALAACLIVSLYDVRIGSWALTLYVCWSPWHFAGQNFGVAMMSLRRRSVPVDRVTRQLLRGSFSLAFLLAMVAIQTEGARPEIAVGAADASTYDVIRLGIPWDVSIVLRWILGPAFLAVTLAALLRLARGGHARQLGPTVMLLSTHSLWYALPAVMTEQIPLIYTAIWISAIHSVQYLWIAAYYSKQADATRGSRFLWKCLVVGSAQGAIIPLLFAPGLLGPFVPFAADVPVIFFSFVNIHHFILDGAIWKLRDGRVGQILLRQDANESRETAGPATTSYLRSTIYVLGSVALVMPVYYLAEIGRAVSSPSHDTVESAASRLSFLGREHPDVYFVLGQHRNLAGDVEGAKDAYRRALAIDPIHAEVAYRLAALLLRDPANNSEALRLAEVASLAADHENAGALIILGRANVQMGRPLAAREAFERALAVALEQGDGELAEISRRRLRRLGRPPTSGNPDPPRNREMQLRPPAEPAPVRD